MFARPDPRRDLDLAALTVAMSVAPGVYARNRMFAFFARGIAAKARSRAKLVRSVVMQISRAKGLANLVLVERDGAWGLSFAIPTMGFTRSLTLTREELAALRYLLGRVGSQTLPATEEDLVMVHAVLSKLAPDGVGGG